MDATDIVVWRVMLVVSWIVLSALVYRVVTSTITAPEVIAGLFLATTMFLKRR